MLRSIMMSSLVRMVWMYVIHFYCLRFLSIVSVAHLIKLNGECQVLHYEGYGASYIKTHKTSPDAWVQLVKQLAFFKMFGRPPVVYESAQTRKFQHGRTEVIRSTSNEAVEFVKAMEDPKQSVRAFLSSNLLAHRSIMTTCEKNIHFFARHVI